MAQPTGNRHPTPDAGHGRHRERLTVSWWLWLPALALATLLSAEVYLGAPGWPTWLPYLVLLPTTAGVLWLFGRVRVAVEDGELRVDDARLPVRFVAGVTVLGPAEKRLLMGPAARRHAFIVQRPWVPGAVQVHLDDPADPTPYWLVSSRRPAALAAALLAARDGP